MRVLQIARLLPLLLLYAGCIGGKRDDAIDRRRACAVEQHQKSGNSGHSPNHGQQKVSNAAHLRCTCRRDQLRRPHPHVLGTSGVHSLPIVVEKGRNMPLQGQSYKTNPFIIR